MPFTVDAAMEKKFKDLVKAEPGGYGFTIYQPANQFPLKVTPEKLVMTANGHLDVQIKNTTDEKISVTVSIHSFCFVITRIWLTKKDGNQEDINKRLGDEVQYDFTSKRNVFNVRIAFAKNIDPTEKLSSDFKNIEGFLEICSDLLIEREIDSGYYIPPRQFHLKTTRRCELSIDFENERILEIKQLLPEYHKNSKRMERIKGIQSDEEKANRLADELEKKRQEKLRLEDLPDDDSCYWPQHASYDWDTLNKEVLRSIWKTMDSLSDDEIMKIKKEKKVELEKKEEEERKRRSEGNDRKRKAEERKMKRKMKTKCCVIL